MSAAAVAGVGPGASTGRRERDRLVPRGSARQRALARRAWLHGGSGVPCDHTTFGASHDGHCPHLCHGLSRPHHNRTDGLLTIATRPSAAGNADARLHASPRPDGARRRAHPAGTALSATHRGVAPLLHRGAAPGYLTPHQGHRRAHRAGLAGAGPRGRRDPPVRRALLEPARGAGRDGRRHAATSRPCARTPTRRTPTPRNPDVSGAWLSFSASGDVTAPVVYANSGNPEDYDWLRQARHRPARARSCIVRYSNPYSYRGFKALTAEREGAAGMIIYSDPAEDGYAQGQGLPARPVGAREPHPARRHHLRLHRARRSADAGLGVGPGRARASRPEEAVSVPKIIGVPMSWRDMQADPRARSAARSRPTEWQGALPDRRTGSGGAATPARQDGHATTDVAAELGRRGPASAAAERPDEWIVLGNHHDAWVFGGVDPSSGTAADDGADAGARADCCARASGRGGPWSSAAGTPRRSRSRAPPSGASSSPSELKRKAVAYLNVDSSASGPHLEVSAVGSLAPHDRGARRRS